MLPPVVSCILLSKDTASVAPELPTTVSLELRDAVVIVPPVKPDKDAVVY